MSAIISSCGVYRYRLERNVSAEGVVYAFFGVNCSTATATEDDQTVKKWIGFTQRLGGKRLIVGNAFAYRAMDVSELNGAADPVGPDNDAHLDQIIRDADILVPCWGSRTKIPPRLHGRLDTLRARIFEAGKPVKAWGFTQSGDPLHAMVLGYSTPLVDWTI